LISKAAKSTQKAGMSKVSSTASIREPSLAYAAIGIVLLCCLPCGNNASGQKTTKRESLQTEVSYLMGGNVKNCRVSCLTDGCHIIEVRKDGYRPKDAQRRRMGKAYFMKQNDIAAV